MIRLAFVALLGLFTVTSAVAADLRPAYKAVPLTERAYNWTGFYLGANVGYLSGFTSNDTGILPNGDAKSLLLGVQGGYLYQFANNVVLGAQIVAPLYSKDQSLTVFGNFNNVETKYSILGQLVLGYAVGPVLPYVTAGLGTAKVEAFEVTAGGVRSLTVTNNHDLYSLGFGVKYAVTNNWSLGLAYNHVWTSRERYDCGPAVCGIVGAFDLTSNTVMASLDYKF